MKWTNWLLVCFLLAGCGTVPTATPTPVATKTFVPLIILTQTPTPTKYLTATITPTTTATFTPSATPKLTLTPLPTSDNSTIAIWRLLLNNGGCRLPCFWGITPGKTTIEEFYQFVNQFPENSMDHKPGFYTFYYFPPDNGDAAFPVIFFDDGSIIRGVGIKLATAYLSFPLTRLLSEYGIPDHVLMSPDQYGYQMFVLYERQRIVGQYRLFANDKYLCYQPTRVTGIITWAQGDYWLDYVNNLFGKFTDQISASSLKPLEQSTEYDMKTFYKQFSTRNRDICMKTLETSP